MSGRGRAGWVLAYAAATFGAFPQPLAGGVLDLGVPLAFVAPACLWRAVEGLAPRRALALGFGAGLAAHVLVLHWIYVVTVTYGHAWPPIGALAVVLLAAYVAAFPGLVALASAWLGARATTHPVARAAVWTALDHLRSFALTGFPWATIGYALHGDLPLRGLAPYTGVYGLSFAAALGGASGAALLAGRRRQAAVGAVVLAGLHGAGALGGAASPETGPTLRVAVAQGNIEQGLKWTRPWAERTLAIYEDLSRRAVREGAELIVWPETAVPGSPDADPDLAARLVALARELETPLVVGAVGVDPLDPAAAGPRAAFAYFDSAFVVDAAGIRDRYDKTHLVPYGEYVPLRDWLGRFVSALATGVASGDVTPGAEVRAVVLPAAADGAGEEERALPVGVPICYELLFPDLMRRFAADGARVLLAVTNDAWYGRTGAPHQFLQMTAMRSAESRLWTARAANTGVSALIDDRGRVRAKTRIFERDVLVGDVKLRDEGARPTFYVRHGDWFAGACWAGVAALGVAALRRAPQAAAGGEDG